MTIRSMTCCCCGNSAGRWKQHWNRDTGYGICKPCVEWVRSRGETEAEIADLYGKESVNWGEAFEPRSADEAAERADNGRNTGGGTMRL